VALVRQSNEPTVASAATRSPDRRGAGDRFAFEAIARHAGTEHRTHSSGGSVSHGGFERSTHRLRCWNRPKPAIPDDVRPGGEASEISCLRHSGKASDADVARLPRAMRHPSPALYLVRALETLGLGRGMRVAILAPISPEALAVRYGAATLGCVTVLCPNTGDRSRLRQFLGHVRADVLVVFPETAGAAATVVTDGSVSSVVSMGPVADVDLDLLALSATMPAVPVTGRAAGDDLGVLVSSGGRTGSSKASPPLRRRLVTRRARSDRQRGRDLTPRLISSRGGARASSCSPPPEASPRWARTRRCALAMLVETEPTPRDEIWLTRPSRDS
jgi:hypothetical protein